MTCIIGLLNEENIYIGGDSAGVGGLSLSVRADSKVFIKDNFIMGFASSFRMGQLLRYELRLPFYHNDVDPFEYMVTKFIHAVRECLKNGGYAIKKDEQESAGEFLVGFQKRLFYIDSDYQVAEQVLRFHAIGCGADLALGSMFTSIDREPRMRITCALEAAERFSAGVRRPFHIEML